MADTSVRRGPGRPPIDTERVISTALQIVDGEGGSDGLNMRDLAARLRCSTATLYRHFPTRAALLAAVIDRMFDEVIADPAAYRDLPWPAAARRFAENVFEVMGRHCRVSLLMVDDALWLKETGSPSCPIGPNAAAVRERWLAIMLEHGFPVRLAARSGAMIGHLVLGFAVQLGTESTRPQRERQDSDTLEQYVNQSDLRLFPATSAVVEARWKPTTVEEEFAFALELVLDRLWALREQ